MEYDSIIHGSQVTIIEPKITNWIHNYHEDVPKIIIERYVKLHGQPNPLGLEEYFKHDEADDWGQARILDVIQYELGFRTFGVDEYAKWLRENPEIKVVSNLMVME